MRVVAALATLAAVAQARLTGFSVPEFIQPGDTVNVDFLNEIYIQAVENVGCSLGYHAPGPVPQSIGTRIADILLGPTKSNLASGFSEAIQFPASIPQGPANLKLACFSLYGVFGQATIETFEVNVTFADATNGPNVSSELVDPGN